MTPHELRLSEIRFYELLNTYICNTPDPMQVYKFVEICAKMFNIDELMLRAATRRCIIDDVLIRPSQHEIIVLYTKMGMGPRPISRKLGINTGSYYHAINKYEDGAVRIDPRFTEKQSLAIHQFIEGLRDMTNIFS